MSEATGLQQVGQEPEHCRTSEAVGAAGVHNGCPVTKMAIPVPTSALERASDLKRFPAVLSLKYILLPLLFTKGR